MTDKELEQKIEALKQSIDQWAKRHELKDYWIKSFDEHFQEDPNYFDSPCVLVLCVDGDAYRVVVDGADRELQSEFEVMIRATDFWYDFWSSSQLVFFAKHEALGDEYRNYYAARQSVESAPSPAQWPQILERIREPREGSVVGRIVYANTGVTMILNEFCVIVHESEGSVWLAPLQSQRTYNGSENTGYESPVVGEAAIQSAIEQEQCFRARRRKTEDGSEDYWGNLSLFFPWDGKPRYFDAND